MPFLPSQERLDTLTRKRILNDAELLKGNAEIKIGQLVVSEEQRQAAQREMLFNMWRDARLYSREPQSLLEDFVATRDDLIKFAAAGGIKASTANMAWTALQQSVSYGHSQETGLEAITMDKPTGNWRDKVDLSGESLQRSLLEGRLQDVSGLGSNGLAILSDYISYKAFEQEYFHSQAPSPQEPAISTA